MKNELIVFKKEAGLWLESLEREQALFCVNNITKILAFAEKNKAFFQGCGLYIVGSSLKNNQEFNDIDVVLVGLDFRAIVAYDKIFLMDPKTLIEKEVLVEPRLFSILKGDKDDPEVIKPVTQCSDADDEYNWEAYGRMGLEYNGILYDYNIEECAWEALNLIGYCSYHAKSSPLMQDLNESFSSEKNDGLDTSWFNDPFENYSFGPKMSFLVYRFSIGINTDLPTVHAKLQDIKPIDFCIHTENLQLEEWKRYQQALNLSYVMLKEWPQKSNVRKIITDLEYPSFIDPNGVNRVRPDLQWMPMYKPKKAIKIIDI